MMHLRRRTLCIVMTCFDCSYKMESGTGTKVPDPGDAYLRGRREGGQPYEYRMNMNPPIPLNALDSVDFDVHSVYSDVSGYFKQFGFFHTSSRDGFYTNVLRPNMSGEVFSSNAAGRKSRKYLPHHDLTTPGDGGNNIVITVVDPSTKNGVA